MYLPTVGERAAQLPWIWPDVHSLWALTQGYSPTTWCSLRRDPAALLLVLRHLSPFAAPDALVPERLTEPRILETVLRWFQNDRGSWVDWRHPAVLPLYQTALAIAHQSRILASATAACDEDAAWLAGLLVPLGWFAVAAVDPSAIALCRADPRFADDPAARQRECWGLDHGAITRRLIRRWQLPEWLGTIAGPGEPAGCEAGPAGAESGLIATIQLGIVLAEWEGHSLGLARGINGAQLQQKLGLGPELLLATQDRFRAEEFGEIFNPDWQDPRQLTEVQADIHQEIARRRAGSTPFQDLLEQDRERLHNMLFQLRRGEEDRLRNDKLAALAEFAAGASHEINNPLAVISGQSQYLLKGELDEPQRKALESIIRQTQRIHAILVELMQFARPPRIIRQRIALNPLLAAAVEEFHGVAGEAGVRLDCLMPGPSIWIDGDPRQLQTALGCLVRNAIEAASPAKGWARISARELSGRVDVLVEDSGPGLSPAQRERMFDPFFSGRSAGRGRGLGLPTAWRLARENGGDVRCEPTTAGPTRFVLSLPLPDAGSQTPERKSA